MDKIKYHVAQSGVKESKPQDCYREHWKRRTLDERKSIIFNRFFGGEDE